MSVCRVLHVTLLDMYAGMGRLSLLATLGLGAAAAAAATLAPSSVECSSDCWTLCECGSLNSCRAPVWMTLVRRMPPPPPPIRTDCGLRGCSRLTAVFSADWWQSLSGFEPSGDDGLEGDDDEEHLDGVAPDLKQNWKHWIETLDSFTKDFKF